MLAGTIMLYVEEVAMRAIIKVINPNRGMLAAETD